MNSQQSPTELQHTLEDDARVLAVSLARLLAASSLSDREKAAWATLLPEMRLDQLSRFATALDSAVMQSAKTELADVMTSIQAVMEKHAAQQAQADHDFMQRITGMVEDLRRAQRGVTS
jgi:hypothetical protein